MVTPLKKVPIHLQSAQNRLIIKNGTVVHADGEEQLDIYVEVGLTSFYKYLYFYFNFEPTRYQKRKTIHNVKTCLSGVMSCK